jgi:hypothetical protein
MKNRVLQTEHSKTPMANSLSPHFTNGSLHNGQNIFSTFFSYYTTEIDICQEEYIIMITIGYGK